MPKPEQKLTLCLPSERFNVNFFLRIDDGHCDRIPFSLITDQTHRYNPSCSNHFKQLLFFDEIYSLFSKNVPLNMHDRTENCYHLNKRPRKKNESICRKKS